MLKCLGRGKKEVEDVLDWLDARWGKQVWPSGIPKDFAIRYTLDLAVYGSRDVKNRINRRISKETPGGRVVAGGNYSHLKTACKHEQVDYVARFQGMTDEKVKSHIMPLLAPERDAYINNVPVTSIRLRASLSLFTSREARFYNSASGE